MKPRAKPKTIAAQIFPDWTLVPIAGGIFLWALVQVCFQ